MAVPLAPDLVLMTAGDARAWDAVQRWRAADPPGSGWWGRLCSLAMSGLRLLPGAGLVDDLVLGTVAAAGAAVADDPARAVAAQPAVVSCFTPSAHCEIARGMPALGTGLGVVLSTRQIARVLETAEHLYTERFLREKYGADLAGTPETSYAAS